MTRRRVSNLKFEKDNTREQISYMKDNYAKPDFSFLELDLESAVLNGSLTAKPIKISTVEVVDYGQGFSDTVAPNGFQDISFE